MTDTTQPAADAVATTPVAPEQAQTPATIETAAPETAVETAETGEEKREQLRDAEGKFLPNHPRVEKLQTKINDLTRQKHDAAREVARLRAEAQEIRQSLAQEPDIAPDDFRAQQTHEVRRALKEERLEGIQKQASNLEYAAQNATVDIIAAQAETLREQIPDIDRIYLKPSEGGPPVTPIMAEALSRIENGALVAYHLLKNPREAARIATSDPLTVATEIGRLSYQVKPAAPARRVSQAPQPVQTVSGSPGTPAPDMSALSFKDYEKIMNERELSRA